MIVNRRSRGQAMVETIMVLPILIMIIMSMFWFARVLITQQMLTSAARYGTDMIVYTNLTETQIRNEIKEYLSGSQIEGRKLDGQKLNENTIVIKKYKPGGEGFSIGRSFVSGFSNYHSMIKKFRGMVDAFQDNTRTSSVEIKYDFPYPPIFSTISRFFGGSDFKDKITISARSEVLAGTGAE